MPNLETGSVSLHYQFDGDPQAPVLLLSNSLGSTLEMWEPQMEEFTRSFRVLRYDMRGHGKSSTPSGPYTIEDLANDVVALMDGLSLRTVDFCGLSIGGVIGQFLAAFFPTRLRKLILSNTSAKIGSFEIWNLRIAKVQSSGVTAIADAVLANWFTQSFQASHASVTEKMRKMLLSMDPAGYASTCAALRDMDQREIVHSISTPACIVAGEHDPVTTLADGEALQQSIPNSILRVVPASHISNVEAPEAFNAAVLEFLTAENIV